jgi:hypothetical protein
MNNSKEINMKPIVVAALIASKSESFRPVSYGEPGFDVKKTEQESRYCANVSLEIHTVIGGERIEHPKLGNIYISCRDPEFVARMVPGKSLKLTLEVE